MWQGKYLMGYVKFRVYVPPESIGEMREAVRPVIAKSDKYMGAMSWYPVKSAWTTLPGASPYNGTVGEETVADEYILEFRVEERDKDKALDIIMKAHPYEEPGIDILPML